MQLTICHMQVSEIKKNHPTVVVLIFVVYNLHASVFVTDFF